MRPVLLALALVSCSSSDGVSNTPAAAPTVHALFGPRETTRLTPYPSDRYTRDDPGSPTGLRVDVRAETTGDPLIATYPQTVADLDRLDGFSTVGGVYVNFDGDVDPASLREPGAAALVDVDDASPDKGKSVSLVPLYATTSDAERDYTSVDHTALFQPARPLRPRTKYLFVLTDRVRAQAGARVAPSDDTRALLDGRTDDPYARSVRATLPILEASTGIARASIVLATHFTTQTVHDELLAAAAARRAAEPPKIVAAPSVAEGPVADGRVRFALSFEAPEYRTKKPAGRFVVEGGKPAPQSTATLEALLAFSDATKSGPRPIVIFGHGLGGTKDGVWGTAERLKSLNVAVFGIDAPEHGSRGEGAAKDPLTPVFSFFGIEEQTKGESFVIARARDNFRQMALDQLELVRLIRSLGTLDLLPIGAPDGVPDLDPDRILYLGHSFGSVMGPTIAALAPEIRAACWNVGGAGLMPLLRDSNTFRFVVDAFRPPGTPTGDVVRFFAITQGIVDPGDPANFAKYVTLEPAPGVADWRPRDVLLQEVFGDTIVPNSTTELLARAAGLEHQLPAKSEIPFLPTTRGEGGGAVSGNLASGATGALAQFERGADGKLIDHGSLIFAPEGRAQYVEFFRSALEGKATIPPPP